MTESDDVTRHDFGGDDPSFSRLFEARLRIFAAGLSQFVLLLFLVSLATGLRPAHDAGSRMHAVWVRFELTRLETRTKESTHMCECMLLKFMRLVKAAVGNFVPMAYFAPRKKV